MESNLFLGYLVIGLGTLVGLFLTVGKPIITLNTNLVELNLMVKQLRKDFDKLEVESHEEVTKLGSKNDEAHKRFSNTLSDHEERLVKLETSRTRKKKE